MVGKYSERFASEWFDIYRERLVHYARITWKELPAGKGSDREKKEGEQILKLLEPGEKVFLLDERGKTFTSKEFSRFLGKYRDSSNEKICFVLGGAYGYSKEVLEKATGKISLSDFTFPHLLARVIFAEQLYRAFTILKGEDYHH